MGNYNYLIIENLSASVICRCRHKAEAEKKLKEMGSCYHMKRVQPIIDHREQNEKLFEKIFYLDEENGDIVSILQLADKIKVNNREDFNNGFIDFKEFTYNKDTLNYIYDKYEGV